MDGPLPVPTSTEPTPQRQTPCDFDPQYVALKRLDLGLQVRQKQQSRLCVTSSPPTSKSAEHLAQTIESVIARRSTSNRYGAGPVWPLPVWPLPVWPLPGSVSYNGFNDCQAVTVSLPLFPLLPVFRTNPPAKTPNVRSQNARSEQDFYTAAWICGEGSYRAGWCGWCSCATRRPFALPEALRCTLGSKDWEAFCGVCKRWMSIGKGTRARATYFRHAYKCHGGPGRQPRAKSARLLYGASADAA
ncbi:hypothetical protein BAUCODRAFT_61818 [Baudoinia panamericana UAMH 10762]|uniref:Uncharacterized protein n=1 Tax=Baudoinia panamericana (strain UAMH 10762) TaxID=717646 RepID=M2M220_BAUPA|nr:uncharacterized protein BAUCODRAFT_61818 [Baudoinia panamericana UAMH 10762]EMD01128.1 hypothetical protein BAUCODRAFT_61818 [Baudoinia panamericana UAMH 10762]